ncbi:MAG: stage III sporulation protein AF, partial [Clostridia bacterium]|nr:stage III sporulation protein AF [Clostridia bacterium]
MMEMFQELTRNLVLLLLLATFLEMLLPKSDLTRYIRLVVGLFVLLTILQPVLDLFDWQGNVSLPIREPPQEKVEALINQGIVFGEYQQATALQVAEERLE